MSKSAISAIDVAVRALGATTALRAVDYLRVSTEDQTKGYGIAYTGRKTAAHITRKQWAHVETFKDEGESGTLAWQDREGATQIMTLAVQTPRPFDVVVVYETRAIGRKNRVFWEWVWKLQDLGVFVAVVDEDIDNTTEDGEARMREKANEAFKELARIRKRTQGGIQEKAETGGFPGGQAHYGYRLENKGKKGEQRLAIDNCDGGETCSRADPCTTIHEADVLRRGRALVVKYKGNWRRACIALNALGLVTRSGAPWSHPNLRSRLLDENLLKAQYIFRNSKNAQLTADGTPVWGESITLKLDPIFTEEEVAELLRVTDKPARTSASGVAGRIYMLSGRISAPCGKHYTGSSPTNEAPHYVCAGKREAYPGAPKCSCSQLDAKGIEKWAWEAICERLGNPERLRSMVSEWTDQANGQKVDFASRLAELDQKIAEQNDTIDVTMAVAAKQATRRGLSPKDAERAVDKVLKPLLDELEELETTRTEIEVWQAEASQSGQRTKDLQALAQMAHERLEDLAGEQQAEFMELLDIKIEVTGPASHMHRGLACPVGEWFRINERLVPVSCDHVWALVMESERFPGGGMVPRQAGGLAPRVVFEAFLKKARTGVAWPELDAEYGSTGLIGHWRRWTKSGRWERVLAALEGSQGVPVAPAHPLPPMQMTGEVRPGLILAMSDRESHVPESGPSAPFSNVTYQLTASIGA